MGDGMFYDPVLNGNFLQIIALTPRIRRINVYQGSPRSTSAAGNVVTAAASLAALSIVRSAQLEDPYMQQWSLDCSTQFDDKTVLVHRLLRFKGNSF